jgi:hypothetical protein
LQIQERDDFDGLVTVVAVLGHQQILARQWPRIASLQTSAFYLGAPIEGPGEKQCFLDGDGALTFVGDGNRNLRPEHALIHAFRATFQVASNPHRRLVRGEGINAEPPRCLAEFGREGSISVDHGLERVIGQPDRPDP